jgi:hypothetical protein
MRRSQLLILALLLSACGSGGERAAPAPATEPEAPEAPAEPTAAAFDTDDPETCAACHGAVVEEWRSSMHASAHHDADPVYGGMRRLRMERQGEAVGQRCGGCHGPRSADDMESEVARIGVGCATCHQIEAISDEGHGGRRIRYADASVFRGPHGTGAGAPHTIGDAAPWITDGQSLCLTCHGDHANPRGAPTCTTGSELGAQTAVEATCTGCHMPEVDRPSGAVSPRSTHRSHAFLGPHRLWDEDEARRAEGVAFFEAYTALDARLDGSTLEATVQHASGHHLPSGFPGRVVVLQGRAFDADGEVLWTDQALFLRRYGDAEGNPVMPPFATQILDDSRLVSGEPRTVRFDGVPDAAVRVEARLLLRLVPPPAVAPLGLEGRPEAEPRVIRAVTLSRGEAAD